MTNKELIKKSADLSARMSALTDKIQILENDISNFKSNVSADMKRLIALLNKQK